MFTDHVFVAEIVTENRIKLVSFAMAEVTTQQNFSVSVVYNPVLAAFLTFRCENSYKYTKHCEE